MTNLLLSPVARMVSSKGEPDKPELREKIKNEVKQMSKGGGAGSWSAWKAGELAKRYEAAGGGYKDKGEHKNKSKTGPPEKQVEGDGKAKKAGTAKKREHGGDDDVKAEGKKQKTEKEDKKEEQTQEKDEEKKNNKQSDAQAEDKSDAKEDDPKDDKKEEKEKKSAGGKKGGSKKK